MTHSRPIIMGVSEYIDKMRLRDPLLLKCENHLEVRPQTFCLNCEKWLCEECIKAHLVKSYVNNVAVVDGVNGFHILYILVMYLFFFALLKIRTFI